MEYSQAKNIRGKSFSEMMLDQMETSGVVKSVGKTISKKMQAKATGFKEKFDPLNIVKFATGGSKLATGIAGKLMGRSQSDINYFTGRKSRASATGGATATRLSVASGDGLGGSATRILTDIYDFMVKSHEEDKQIREIQNSFQEEKQNESNRKHKEFVDKLKEFVDSRQQPEIRIIGQKEPGVLEKMSDMLGNFASKVKDFFGSIINSIITTVESFVKGLFEFLAKTVVGAMIAQFFKKMKGWLVSGLTTIFKAFFGLLPKIFSRMLLQSLASMFGRGLLFAFKLLTSNPVLRMLTVLGTTGFIMHSLIKNLSESESGLKSAIGASENTISSLNEQLKALPPPRGGKIVNGEMVVDDPYEDQRKSLMRRIAEEEGKISKNKKKLEILEQNKTLEKDIESGKEMDSSVWSKALGILNGTDNLKNLDMEQKQDENTLIDKIRQGFSGDIDMNFDTDKLLENAPKMPSFNIMNNSNPIGDLISENVSLNQDQMFATKGGSNIINQTVASQPTTREVQMSVPAKVRDDTRILNRVFESSTVFV